MHPDGMLLPPLCTQDGYVELATATGLTVLAPPKDISRDVSKTWYDGHPNLKPDECANTVTPSRDISWSLVQNPSLWAFALSQGRDGIAFLQSFRAMRRGYSNGAFRYAVMAFKK
jgi:tocopherol O-methyltransferase